MEVMSRTNLLKDLEGLGRSCCPASDEERERRRKVLRFAREAARRSALRSAYRLATIDEVHERLSRAGHAASALGNAAGSVFRTAGWQATPFRVRSRRAGARSREVKVWTYSGKSRDACVPPCRRLSLVAVDRATVAEAVAMLSRLELDEAPW